MVNNRKSGYPIPSKDDQQATVDILETTDRIIVSHVASYDRLIEYKKDYSNAYLYK